MTGTTINPVIVKIGADTSAFELAIDECLWLLPEAPESIRELAVSVVEAPEKLCRIRSDRAAASAADEVRVVLEPGNGLLRLLAALRVGNADALICDGALDVSSHVSVSVGSVGTASEEQLPGESQGSSGSGARNSQGGVI